jgi:hypothetical protein
MASPNVSFTVGSDERHLVEFSHDKFWGKTVITVDGVPVMKSIKVAGLKLTRTHQFAVGVNETHLVRIDLVRKQFFAGFRPMQVYAYVDGLPVAEGVV